LLPMVRALPERPIVAAPRVLGVDEFALRRGRRYGTILVDVGTHRVVDPLEDPSADALVEWLGKHPGTEVICRDRDGVYASAARRGAPGALQVADRWHLTHNLADALERFAVRALALLRKELKAEEAADAAPPRHPNYRRQPRRARHRRLETKGQNQEALVAMLAPLLSDTKSTRRVLATLAPPGELRPGRTSRLSRNH
jgi:transposase